MSSISDSVGADGKNEIQDVALVQAMLKLIKNSKGTPYFSDPYTNKVSRHAGVSTDPEERIRGCGRELAKMGASQLPWYRATGKEPQQEEVASRAG